MMLQVLFFLMFFQECLSVGLKCKVGQVFIAPVYERELSDKGRDFLRETGLGNIIYFGFANGPFTKEQITRLSNELREAIEENVGIKPLIAIDQEGKGVNQLKFCEGSIGKMLEEVGVNMDLAPVVDVVVRDDCPLKKRSYGDNPEVVIECAREMIQNLHNHGIHAVLKHFPGLGNTVVDSHIGLPSVVEMELRPFIALKDEADAIMVAHVMVQGIGCASLSKRVVTGVLREQMGFDKVIITDALVMKGVLGDVYGFEEAVDRLTRIAIEAFLAGSDLLLLARLECLEKEQNIELVRRVMEGFLRAVESGEIGEERLDMSVERILRMKACNYLIQNSL